MVRVDREPELCLGRAGQALEQLVRSLHSGTAVVADEVGVGRGRQLIGGRAMAQVGVDDRPRGAVGRPGCGRWWTCSRPVPGPLRQRPVPRRSGGLRHGRARQEGLGATAWPDRPGRGRRSARRPPWGLRSWASRRRRGLAHCSNVMTPRAVRPSSLLRPARRCDIIADDEAAMVRPQQVMGGTELPNDSLAPPMRMTQMFRQSFHAMTPHEKVRVVGMYGTIVVHARPGFLRLHRLRGAVPLQGPGLRCGRDGLHPGTAPRLRRRPHLGHRQHHPQGDERAPRHRQAPPVRLRVLLLPRALHHRRRHRGWHHHRREDRLGQVSNNSSGLERSGACSAQSSRPRSCS